MKADLPSGDYIAGFVDGEGCFALNLRRDVRHERKGNPVYYSWKAAFIIVLHKGDCELLEKIKRVLGCGSIHTSAGRGTQCRYQVTNINELEYGIIPFFQKHKLHGKKRNDFTIWSKAVNILAKYKNRRGKVNIEKGTRGFNKIEWTKEDMHKLIESRDQMNKYKTKGTGQRWSDKQAALGREAPSV